MARLSRHAKNRMRLYGVSEALVDCVMTDPDRSWIDGGGRKCEKLVQLTHRTVMLRVVAALDDADFIKTVIVIRHDPGRTS